MGRDRSNGDVGARDAARDRAHPPSSLREAELPLRRGRGAARVRGAELLDGFPDQVRDASGGRSGGSPSGDRTLPGGQGSPRGGGGARPGAADRVASAGLSSPAQAFSSSQAIFSSVAGFLFAEESQSLTHSELEARIVADVRGLARQLYQDHLDLRAVREARIDGVNDAGGTLHNAIEPGHHRQLETIVGEVTVTRLAYRARGKENLHLADAALNLPTERHSHGLSELAAIEATRGSYKEAQAAIERSTGIGLGKRQVEALTRSAASDVDVFYARLAREPADQADTLVISADGKGIVMRPDALRAATKNAAARPKKLKTRLSKGEKKDRKRIAELAVVYDAAPVERSAEAIFSRGDGEAKPEAPEAKNKWLTASVVEDAAEVISDAFDEATRRDPERKRRWVALVDGANHQIARIRAEAKRRGVEIAIVVDLVHVVEYIWGAAWCFFDEGDPAAEAWVAEKALAVLEGKSGIVAGAIRRKATYLGLDEKSRKKADECARYLKNKAPYLDYPKALAAGWPIATGVIEGACAHLVRDRFDITGARWSLEGAEAMLKLRAVRANGDWSGYWRYHLAEERRRVHERLYIDGVIPQAA